MTDDAHLAEAPAGPAVDLRHLDGTLANLRRAERDVAAMAAGLAASSSDPEAARAVRMAWAHLRGEAASLASQFAHLAQDGAL